MQTHKEEQVASSELDEISSSLENVYEKAAQLIYNSKYLLITCGAGFSKDSGLAVYKDIASNPIYQEKNLTYHDLARPVSTFETEQELLDYYGFWVNCAQSYLNTPSHSGYQILKDWKQLLYSKKEIQKEFNEKQIEILSASQWWKENCKIASNMFIYSSNVDNHFSRYFEKEEIYNIHGHALNWQCGNHCNEDCVWNFTKQLQNIIINQETLQIDNEKLKELKCEKCQHASMPNVLMFGDLGQYIRNTEEEDRYIAWECSVETFSKESSTKFPFIILELGCGLTVPSVRRENECVLLDCDESYLIRVNLGQEELDTIHNVDLIPMKNDRILNIKNGCQDALHRIHQHLLKIIENNK
ncbi:Sir2 NAD-dependent protein deacetylase [Naegleria gruberi]|uniref:Sir2 NAD-dependent protein deacetylase n=1 Tax=Naegleria gruberi TaxID=5762 RepID=D2VVJ2_NAEGR|nr:Sir2 NAD-dependent protein deacetylase [Naegleria gruberi]EFC39044.1 Sir2 NAD-dependent protein deacetylase [Naegleria gruberi]|eukprot:XP_002671788.1 Sir2 NAD-dependent protein deacetylase [Naegleria gruberi strain NEG-M]